MGRKQDFSAEQRAREQKGARQKLAEYEAGVASCEACGTRIALADHASLTLAPCPHCGDIIFVPWRIEDWWTSLPLAAGGFGAVYLGRSRRNPDEQVAIKVLQEDKVPDRHVVDLFLAEGETGYSFDANPNLASTLAVGEHEERAFIVQEFVEGPNLNEHIATHKALPPEECLYYTLDMIHALQHILAKGFVYRDMKPENVILRDTGMAVLIDYGTCEPVEHAAKADPNRPVLGSPLYMPPERYLKQGDDVRGDIYSLGMTLYFMLKGEPYFSSQEVKTVARGHTNQLRIPTETRLRGMPPEMIALVDGMIRRDRQDRFQTYDDLLNALFLALAGCQQTKTKDRFLRARREHFVQTYGVIELSE
jgi:serine/threonine protein kinase/predicted RNA-binding Zn-ribbon protein involved in translation (DUF1610 family)